MAGRRVGIYGPTGAGKTYFGVMDGKAAHKSTLVVDTEDRIGEFGVAPEFVLVPPDPLNDLAKFSAEILARLKETKADRLFIDSFTVLMLQRQVAISGGTGRIQGFDGWGTLKADSIAFSIWMGHVARAGVDVLWSAHQGDADDPLYLQPMTNELDPTDYKKPYGEAPRIRVPLFDGAFKDVAPHYTDFLVYCQEVPSREKVTHRYFFERRGMFMAKKPPTASMLSGWEDDVTYSDIVRKLEESK